MAKIRIQADGSGLKDDGPMNPRNVVVQIEDKEGQLIEDNVVNIFKNIITRARHDRAKKLFDMALIETTPVMAPSWKWECDL